MYDDIVVKIKYLIKEESLSNLARKLNVSRQTIYKWLKKPEVMTVEKYMIIDIHYEATKKLNEALNSYKKIDRESR